MAFGLSFGLTLITITWLTSYLRIGGRLRSVRLGVNSGHQQLGYVVGGFLKPVHGVSLHGILVLPLPAWLLARADLSERRRTRIVALAAAGYTLAIAGAPALSLPG
ncbi:hypothetical protein ACTPOK_03025 [Streptomyces inhibens]|uniref:hypothetical protein n=1 Tax=Streptomyces inhibens TaxID=2293571 RepID=UPI00402A95AB